MRRRALWLLLALLMLLVGLGVAQKSMPGTNRMQRVENGLLPGVVIKGQHAPMKIADRLAYYKVPGVSVAVINNGKIEWAKGYGVTEAGGTKPVTPETRFQAASISKPVAATAALALVQQGKLSLDENVNSKLKSWQVPDNDFTKDEKVTLRRLVNHSAGLTVHGFRGYAADEAVPTLVQALEGQKPVNSAAIRVNVLPGSLWRYSGGGYNVMQQMLIDVTGKTFPALMQELVLSKIGMKHSTYEQPLPKEWEAFGAVGHRPNGRAINGRWHTYPEMAAAGLWTTPSDLARFAIEIQQSLHGKSNKVLSAEMVRQMLTKQKGDYGLGFGLGGKDKITTFSHGGSNEGFKCMLFAYSETGQGAVVMTNGDLGGSLANEILRAIAREYGWPDYQPTEKTLVTVQPELLVAYAGEYLMETGAARVDFPVTVSQENGKMFISRLVPGVLGKFEIQAISETTFLSVAENTEITFVKDEQGRVVKLEVRSGSSTSTAKKVR